MPTPHVLLPLEGSRLRPGSLVDVDHHRLDLDGGLDVDQLVLARCLDDRGWVLRVAEIEFGVATTRYLLEVVAPADLPAPRPRRHQPVTTRQTAFLLRALARTEGNAPATALREALEALAGSER